MATQEGSRKRAKLSTPYERTLSKAVAVPLPKKSANGEASTASASSSSTSCTHEQALKALNTDIDAMRQLVTCKICHRLLYEPYSLSCGHTYCYSCLSQWLVDSRKKTCPDCRAVVVQQPTPSYVIRELVLIFVSRNELLPDGETSDEHHNYVKEEADVVAKDKASKDPRTGGLFKGCFKRGRHSLIGPIHDPGDGVTRCPICMWELENGYCGSCGDYVDGHDPLGLSDYESDSDLSEDDLDHELDIDDARAVFGVDGEDDYLGGGESDGVDDDTMFFHGEPGRVPGNHSRRHDRARRNRDSGNARVSINLMSEEEDSDEDESDANLQGFVVEDDDVQYVSSDEGEDTDVPRPQVGRRGRAPVVVSDDDEDDTAASAGAEPETEQDSEDEGPVSRGSQRSKRGRVAVRQRRTRSISGDEETSDDEHEDHESDFRGTTDFGGFSPLAGSAAEDPDVLDDYESRSGYDSEPASSIHPMDDETDFYQPAYNTHGATYNDNEDNEDSSDDDDDNDGWGMQAETPANRRQPPSTSSHRLQPLGRHANRHTSTFSRHSVPDLYHSTAQQPRRPRQSRASPPSFSARVSHRPYDELGLLRSHRDVGPSSSRSFGMFSPSQHRASLPVHPFQLGNTLNNFNNRAAASSSNGNRNYNQRNQQSRSNPNRRDMSGASSRSSFGGGGVNVGSSSSGSSTVGRPTNGRRKRVLSVSSDDTVEGPQSVYDY